MTRRSCYTSSGFLLLLALCVAALAAPSDPDAAQKRKAPPRKPDAEKAQAEELTFTPPAGWDRSDQERIVVFTPPGVPPSKCALIVTPGENLEEDFLKWFKTKWDALRKGANVVQGGDRTGQDGPNGSSVLYQAALLQEITEARTKKQTGLLLYAVHIGSAVHWVVFRTDGPERFNQYKKTVNQFLAGMKFVETAPADDGGKEKQAAPRPKPAKRSPTEQAAERGATSAGPQRPGA